MTEIGIEFPVIREPYGRRHCSWPQPGNKTRAVHCIPNRNNPLAAAAKTCGLYIAKTHNLHSPYIFIVLVVLPASAHLRVLDYQPACGHLLQKLWAARADEPDLQAERKVCELPQTNTSEHICSSRSLQQWQEERSRL